MGAGAVCDHFKIKVGARVRAVVNLGVRCVCVRPQKRSQLTPWISVKLQGFLSPPYYVFDNLSVLIIYSEVLEQSITSSLYLLIVQARK